MIYNKIFLNVDLDQTPLPILTVFLFSWVSYSYLLVFFPINMNIKSDDNLSNYIKEKIEN